MSGKKGQKKRFWSDDEKRSICAQTTVPGVSVAQVARRYAMNANAPYNRTEGVRTDENNARRAIWTSITFTPMRGRRQKYQRRKNYLVRSNRP